jgi:hypothetical protein
MKARVQLAEGMTFVAESGSGHAVVVDAAPDVGGRRRCRVGPPEPARRPLGSAGVRPRSGGAFPEYPAMPPEFRAGTAGRA